ncbi:UDP-N-acetylglucosamine--undecaprenyl-phosphate N-acetylglucosaminephosphotransferase [Aliidiomarina celeris]|uniref:UDP-N-acetylglucosamine--undecaprenyl-phosphate N-acetylglucosaminephosphotransferase n=1 Tax=Aliidiomarina celeris TaxID=2249428 RepID=UPI000DE8C8C0|nr:UDP-N-acetylglucosamine--undecaprenyl-phosphate N-acetylglucosaminephosphotransferase [Aliidiomarina celeris]
MVFLIILTSSIVAWTLLLILLPISAHIGLVDKPCARKQHNGEIPLIGGLAIATSLLSVWLYYFEWNSTLLALVIASSLMVTTGVLDDKFDLSVRLRIVMQILASSIIVFVGGVEISTLGNVLGFGEIELGVLGGIFTVLAIMTAMNAYNMVDGIDGLLGGLSLVAFVGICILSWMAGLAIPFVFALSFVFALIPYLVLNLQTNETKLKKVFMGDAGSMFIGLSIVWILALLTNPALTEAFSLRASVLFDLVESHPIRPVAVLWLITIPLMDMLGIMVRRIVKKQNPFKPDRNHLHHIFMRAGFSSREALLIIVGSAAWWMFVGIWLEAQQIAEPIVLAAYFAVFAIYLLCLKYSWRLVTLVRRFKGIS